MRVLRVAPGVVRIATLIAILSAQVTAQSGTTAIPPAHKLPAPNVTSPRFVGSVFGIRDLPSGELLINDLVNHHVMLSDSLLKTTTVVIDSTDYGSRPASLLRYAGDSSLFVEQLTPSMRLIDPAGRVVRTMAVPQPRDAGWLMPTPSSMAGVDARGRLVHRGAPPRAANPTITPGEFIPFSFPDSAPIVRDDPITHTGDTLTWTKSIKANGVRTARADGRTMSYMRSDVAPIVDDWVVLASGAIAVVRGRDYHVDIIDADGHVTAGPRIAYPWEPLSDSAKLALIDSLRIEREKRNSAPRPNGGSSGGASSTGSAGVAGGGGLSGAGNAGSDFPPPPPGSMDPKASELPDYRPVFDIGAVRPDVDGNLWIRTREPVDDQQSWIYDVVNGQGKRIDRVLIARNRSIAGFDRRGNIYLVGREDGGVQFIERVKWR